MIEPMISTTAPRPSSGDVAWRTELLRDAGIDRRSARSIAAHGRCDVHALAQLLERGCPLHLALRIVLDDGMAA